MRYSNLYGKTLREAPKNAGPVSLQLLLRAGFLKAAGPGAFLLLPLARRVIRHMDFIIETEATARGIQLLEMPPPPAGNAKDHAAGADWKRVLAGCRPQIRQQYPMAGQHEEDLCLLAGNLPMSYKELPLLLGARQWKCREAGRGQGSLVLARRFPAHVSYAFDTDEASARTSSHLLREVCQVSFRQMGLDFVSVNNQPDSPESPDSEEFVALTDSGDETMVLCDTCDYAAALERAQSRVPRFEQQEAPLLMEAVYGPGIVGTAELAAFVGIPVEKTTKTLLFQADESVVAVCVRGEYDVSETKLAERLGCRELKLAPAAVVKDLTGADVGYAGPVGLPKDISIVWDLSTEGRINFEGGANRSDYHDINVNFGRDLPAPEEFVDVRRAREGEACARCGKGRLVTRKGIRLGHVSRLGTMYSKELKAVFAAGAGKNELMMLTCYGIDLMRVLSAIVERHNDRKGIVWPRRIAPFAVLLISLPGADDRARVLYDGLIQEKIDVLWDDRDTPAGARFGDADLIGIPVRLVVSPRTGENVEWKERNRDAAETISFEEAIRRLHA